MEEGPEIESMPVPEKLKGKLFDKDGNLIEYLQKKLENFIQLMVKK